MSYVIGDIHGEIDKLKALMSRIPLGRSLIFMGDYIDKGPSSRQVVEYLIKLSKKRRAVFLMGNHEFKLLQALQGSVQAVDFVLSYGGVKTVNEYCQEELSESAIREYFRNGKVQNSMRSHLPFWRSLKPYYELDHYFFVHGGVPVDSLGRYRIGNVEKMLFARRAFLPLKKRFRQKVVVFGHTAFTEVFWDGYKLGVDTGAVYEKDNGYGSLTAVDLERFECLTHDGKRYVPRLKKE